MIRTRLRGFLACAVLVSMGSGLSPATAFELIVNGDFSSGNIDFSSDYAYLPGAGQGVTPDSYTVEVNTVPWHGSFVSFPDHTDGTGNMLIANGSITGGVVWSQVVSVVPSSNYTFSFWAASAYSQAPATLRVRFNGDQVGLNMGLSSTPGLWLQYSGVWSSGANTSATIEIDDLVLVGDGNDFTIDDISLTPEPASCALLAMGAFALVRMRRGIAKR